jgi:hypothetical protein
LFRYYLDILLLSYDIEAEVVKRVTLELETD